MSKRKVIERFDLSADLYDVSPEHIFTDDVEIAIKYSSPSKNDVYLDIASGTGHAFFKFLPYVGKAIAADISISMLRRLKLKYKKAFAVVSDAEALSFKDNTFTLVSCRIAPHHFENINNFFCEVKRALKNGGVFILIDNAVSDNEELRQFIESAERLRDPTHIRTYTFSEWEEMISRFFKIKFKKTIRKVHPFEEWVSRAHLSGSEAQKLRELFLNASSKIKSYFEIKIENSKIISYTDDKILIIAENVK